MTFLGKGVLLCGLLGVLLGSGGFTLYYAEGLSYFSDDPRACVNCHVMREPYDGWQKASHHAVATCNDCHIPAGGLDKWRVKAENGWRHSKAFTLQDFHEPIRIRPSNAAVVDKNCVRCHAETVSAITATHADPGSWRCVACHASVGHGATR